MLLVQKFLENHSFEDLITEHGVYAHFSKSGHKFSLSYDQLEAKESDAIAQECRGLILSATDGHSFLSQAKEVNGRLSYNHICPGKTRVVAYPMKRFFNYGQGSAEDIDWSAHDLQIMEKMDGTLIIVYYDIFTQKWCVATRAVPEADLLMDSGLFTFRTLFEKSLKETCGLSFEEYTDKLDKEVTYCFELTTPYNRIVVSYPTCKVTLIAARQVMYGVQTIIGGEEWENFEEFDISKINSFGVPIVQSYNHNSISELLDWVNSLNPMEHEGVVVKQGTKRIKIKNINYIVYNKARDVLGSSSRNCLEIILNEKDDDVIPFLPEEIVNNLNNIKNGLQKTIKYHDDIYASIKKEADMISFGNKKTFAILVQDTIKSEKEKGIKLWQAPFFAIFDGKSSNMKDFIMKNRKSGTWGDSFIDQLLELSK